MREILFRGKGVSRWFYGWYCGKYCDCFTDEAEESSQIIDFDSLYLHEVAPETVGQFTGLTDKNGKKIFEGDIVRCTRYRLDSMGMVGHIVYDEGCFCVKEHKSCNAPAMDLLGDYEVIGNIHDNPELLEVR